MTRERLWRFFLGSVLAATTAHVAAGVAVMASLYTFYPHRMFNVHRWSNDAAANFRLVGTYLRANARTDARPVIAFAGSSVTYGDLRHERLTFARMFADGRSGATVLNTSILAADISALNDWIICAARRNQVRFDALVIELPVVNSASYLVNLNKAGQQVPPLGTCSDLGRDPGYFRFAFLNVRGTGWFSFLWKSGGIVRADRPIRIESVPKGYFASAHDFAAVQGGFTDQIAKTLSHAQMVADAVYAFPSPVFVAGLREVGEDADALQEQLQAALGACRSVAGVRCIDPSALYFQRGYYANLTHLNGAGHRAMAGLLDAHIVAPGN